MRNAAAERVEKVMEDFRREGIGNVESAVKTGSPCDRIIELAEDQDVNAILMGSGHKTSEDRFPLGITADKTIRKARKPVWVVKRGAPPVVRKNPVPWGLLGSIPPSIEEWDPSVAYPGSSSHNPHSVRVFNGIL